jgi:type II secretory pathway pseudopilin PulG
MSETEATARGRRAQAGFTLVEALVAIVVLIFGLMAVTNLLLVAASSNAVANQSTAATSVASGVMDMLKATDYLAIPAGGPPGGLTFEVPPGGGPACDVAVPADFHCDLNVPGVGVIHTHWVVTPQALAPVDPRLVLIQVRSEGTGALSGPRSRAEFTTLRSCTNSDPAAPLPCPPSP